MSTIDERKRIVEDINNLTEQIKQVKEVLTKNFYVSKDLNGVTFHWDNVSMMWSNTVIDNSIDKSFMELSNATKNLDATIMKLRAMLEDE